MFSTKAYLVSPLFTRFCFCNTITDLPVSALFLQVNMTRKNGINIIKKRVVNIPKEINKNILQICKLLHPDMLFVTSTVFSFLFLLWLCCRQNRRRILRGIKFMYNENEKRNIAVSQKGNAIQPAALNIHQLFPSRTKDECLLELKKNPSVYRTYLNWPDKWKNRFLEFMEGKKSLPLTYDPFFKKLFNPDVYPERLSRLISSIIGTKVTVKCILSN